MEIQSGESESEKYDDQEEGFDDLIAAVKARWESDNDADFLVSEPSVRYKSYGLENEAQNPFAGRDEFNRQANTEKCSEIEMKLPSDDSSFAVDSTHSSSAATIPAITIIRIFFGGFVGEQATPLIGALKFFNAISVEYMYVKDVKESSWGPAELVDWLLGGDVHIIPCHPHQGIALCSGWSCIELGFELRRLSNHRGFPTGDKLNCPIFLQDKFEYITRLHTWSLPTLKIDLVESTVTSALVAQQILRFMETAFESGGWVVKLPYSTNNIGLKIIESGGFVEVYAAIYQHLKEYGDVIPYTMLQPKLDNKKEYKFVFVDGQFQYQTSIVGGNSKHCRAFLKTKAQKAEGVRFASDAIELLKNQCPYSILDGLVRVDIMQRNDGSYSVNEFESLEARTFSAGVGGADREIIVSGRLMEYWKIVLTKLLFSSVTTSVGSNFN